MSGNAGARILVVDDDPAVVEFLLEELADEGYAVEGSTSPREAIERVAAGGFDLVIADVEMPEMRGTDLLQAIHRRSPTQLVLLITAFGSIDLAVQAVRAGACDFVTKPFKMELLLLSIERALRERRMRREIVRLRSVLPGNDTPSGIAARSPAMQRVAEVAARAARTSATVLLTGESGVGKGHVARAIHAQGPRSAAPFVQVNCAALPAQLVESELFGVKRGAYTDAREDRPGLFVQAHGGTLFLDEIGELPLESQAKLLHVLETAAVRPVGGSRETPVDVRIIAATNQPFDEALRERRFRPDLYYRLNVIAISIPPLRERREDIDVLLDVLLAHACERVGRPVTGISAAAVRWIRAQDWPGNVRELANVLERAVALSDHDTLLPEDFVDRAPEASDAEDTLVAAAARGVTLADLEAAYIRTVLERVDGNKAEAARVLGIDRRTIYRKLGQEDPSA